MKLKAGEKYTHIYPVNGEWVICTVIKEEVYGYLKDGIYILSNLNGYAFKTNIIVDDPYVYAIDGVICENYNDFLRKSRKIKLKRIILEDF